MHTLKASPPPPAAHTSMPRLFRVCGDLRSVSLEQDRSRAADAATSATAASAGRAAPATRGAKYVFERTGSWWREKMMRAAAASPGVHATPLYEQSAEQRTRCVHVAVHIRRGPSPSPKPNPKPGPKPNPGVSTWQSIYDGATWCIATFTSSSPQMPTM